MSSDREDPPARVPIGLRASPRALERLAGREQALARYSAPALRRLPKRAGAPLRLAAVVLPPTARASVGSPALPASIGMPDGPSAVATELLAAAAPPAVAPWLRHRRRGRLCRLLGLRLLRRRWHLRLLLLQRRSLRLRLLRRRSLRCACF